MKRGLDEKKSVFILKLATAEDFDSLIRFYADNHHHGIERRHREVYWECVQNECVHLIVDEAGQICGSSMTFNYPQLMYAEFGATRIVRPVGFPLYEHLVAAQALHAFFFNPPLKCPVGNVNLSNRKVIERLCNNLSWEEFVPPAELTSVNEALILERDETVQWFACPVKALGRYATLLNGLSGEPVIQNRRGGRISLLCDSLRSITEYGDLLKSLPTFIASSEDDRRFMWAAARQSMLQAFGRDGRT